MQDAHVVSYLRHELANVWNKYVHNDRRGWDTMYAANYAAKLESADQRARHWIVAGAIAELPMARPRVLDIGCGCGTTYACLRRRGVVYHGIDLAPAAVAAARAASAGDPDATFEVVDFERFAAEHGYDAVVLNEVLYYFPVQRVAGVIEKAFDLIGHPAGVLVVSMSDNLKARLAWRECRAVPEPVRSVTLKARARSSRWTIAAFPRQARAQERSWSGRALYHLTGGDIG
jgi:2-polyprenyl-3-methyl-5-hydroxy-6-metoxy-1,4-benzoquinol methylase